MSFTCATTSCDLLTARTSRAWLTALISTLALAACSDEYPCIEYRRTISHGIYGRAKFVATDESIQPFDGVDISISHSISEGLGYFELRTDADGFYEQQLGSGNYSVCSDFAMVSCFYVTLGDDDLERLDLRIDEGLQAYWVVGRSDTCP